MENNIDLDHSFNSWGLSRKKTLKEPKGAYFSHTESSAKSNCQVNFDYTASPWTTQFSFSVKT